MLLIVWEVKMTYLAFLFFTLLFIANTPLYRLLINFIRKKPIIIKFFIIIGDSLYMIGGGIIAGAIMQEGYSVFAFFKYYGIILVIFGAITKETFKKYK